MLKKLFKYLFPRVIFKSEDVLTDVTSRRQEAQVNALLQKLPQVEVEVLDVRRQ